MSTSEISAAASVSTSMQDYLKACYQLSRRGDGEVTISGLASQLEVSAPSASNMVKKLEAQGLIERAAGNLLSLSEQGEAIALEMVRHHRLLETFLINTLGMDWADAHREAEVLEHYISEKLEHLIDQYMSRPKHDPQGEPIPTKSGSVPRSLPPGLLEYEPGEQAEIVQVRSQDPELLAYLQQRELVPGTIITIKEIAPFNGPVSIAVKRKTYHISREVAASIFAQRAATCAA